MDPNSSQPQTIISERQEQKDGSDPSKKFLKPKYIFLGFGIIILIEVIFGVASLLRGTNNSTPNPTQASVTDGAFTLSSSSAKYKVGDSIVVPVDISTGGNSTIGADLILHFDPTILSVTKEAVIPGTAFSTYPLIDADEKSGTIWLSGVSEGTTGFNGKGNLATVTFTAKAKGSTTISVTFKDGDTKDSNLVSTKGEDILKRVTNLNLEIN